jgi:hypothetical protein
LPAGPGDITTDDEIGNADLFAPRRHPAQGTTPVVMLPAVLRSHGRGCAALVFSASLQGPDEVGALGSEAVVFRDGSTWEPAEQLSMTGLVASSPGLASTVAVSRR